MCAVAPSESKQSQSWAELIPPAARLRIALVIGLLLYVYWGTVRYNLAGRWLSDGNWSHGWLIPVFSLYFLSTRRDELMRVRPRPSYVGAAILALSLTVYFVAAWRLRMTYPQSLSLIGSILGVTLLMGGWSVMRVAWFPIAYLLLAIPLPQSIYVELTMPLRSLASSIAAAVMPLLTPGLHTQAQRVVIDYVMPGFPPGSLNVEEACSGMRLMMAFVALGVAVAYLDDRPLWQRVILVASCLPVAVLCNAVRVTTTGLFHVHGRQDLASGTLHQLLGIVMLGLALALYALIGYVLNHLFIEETEAPSGEARST